MSDVQDRTWLDAVAPHAVAGLLCLTLLSACAAQRQAGLDLRPARPLLPSGGDTNSAAAYYQQGISRLELNPDEAAAAFYWAARLDPVNAAALYARRVALLLQDPRRLRAYVEGTQNVRMSREIRSIDSLEMQALRLEPFLLETLDGTLLTHYYTEYVSGPERLAPDLNAVIARHLASEDVDLRVRAWFVATQGRLALALRLWAELAQREPRNSWVHAERARALVQLGALDSARAQMSEALTIARRRDADSTRFIYESKVAWQYMLGRILARLGNAPAAREAYEGALIEDLTYFPAHLQLGQLHFAHGDTTAALREFGRAVETNEGEYLPHATYGYYLGLSGHLDSAAAHLRRAIDLEPFAAAPRMMLAAALDQSGDAAGALEAFEQFLARAARTDPNLGLVRPRVALLRAARH